MIYGNYLKTVPSHCEQRNNDKVKKTISKMDEPPKNGAWKGVFLTEVDFNCIRLFSSLANLAALWYLIAVHVRVFI